MTRPLEAQNRHQCTWSPAEDDAALILAAAGKSHEEVGLVLNRSKHSVSKRLTILRDCAAPSRKIAKQRPCITCRQLFYSSGPGHRMCSRCRQKSTSPFAL